ncbi:MAG: ribbon-helix-helix protein, CopG family [Thermocrispum sp.]
MKQRAAEAGVSAHAWMVAAIEREVYRQLLEKQARWNADHPELVAAANQEHEDHQRWLAEREANRGSSAA